MQGKLHFISGLPRAGSTLLSALLRQNPKMSAGMSSPVGPLFNAMLRETAMNKEYGLFIDTEMRRKLLHGVFDACYADTRPDSITFDTNRMWTTKMSALAQMYPDARVVCCVRNPAWVLDSVESLIQRNAFDLSGIFNFETGGTIYSRVEGLAGLNGMVGYALNALREAVYGAHSDKLMLLRYETLVADPIAALRAVYDFIDEPYFIGHDPDNIAPCDDMTEFDRRMGTPGLHTVGGAVAPRTRDPLLPPDLFERYAQTEFWADPAFNRPGLRVI